MTSSTHREPLVGQCGQGRLPVLGGVVRQEFAGLTPLHVVSGRRQVVADGYRPAHRMYLKRGGRKRASNRWYGTLQQELIWGGEEESTSEKRVMGKGGVVNK